MSACPGRPYRRRAAWVGLALLWAAAPTASQAQPAPASAQETVRLDSAASRVYGGVEYLHWWLKGAPLPVPLVSTGPIDSTHHGFLGHADTTVLYGAPFPPSAGGNDTQEFHGFAGTRLTLGGWLDAGHTRAVEASGFLLQRHSAGYSASSNQNGLPILNIPVYNTIPYAPGGRPPGGPPAEDGLPASLPLDPSRFDGNQGVFAGGITIANRLQLWGADLSAVALLYRAPGFELSGLAGVRHLNLSESFGLLYRSTGVSGVYVGQDGAAFDSFKTANRYYGGSLGLRAAYHTGPLSAEVTGRIGLGANQAELNVNGGFYSYGFQGSYRFGSEGVFAQPANEGRYSRTRFAVVPEAQFKLGYQVTPWLRLTAGYDVLYMTDVIRPGLEINRNIPKGQTFQQGGTADSTTSPARLFRTADFLAQGLNLGVSFSF